MTRRRARSLRWQLLKLCLGILVPTLAFVGVLLWRVAASERARVEEQATAMSHGLAVAFDREVNGVLATLEALATSPSLRSGDMAAFYDQANEVRRVRGIHVSLRTADVTAYDEMKAHPERGIPIDQVMDRLRARAAARQKIVAQG